MMTKLKEFIVRSLDAIENSIGYFLILGILFAAWMAFTIAVISVLEVLL